VSGWPEPAAQEQDDGLPLTGVRVLDFSTLLPGPLATYLLAESGADVVKVERAGVGDEMRGIPPFTEHGTSVRFLLLNGGKRSVSLDLKTDAGLARARELAAAADVLVEQFRPGVMDRLGLGYAELAATNPGLVYCSITGYGQSGPWADRAAHDLNYAADAGMLSLVRTPDGAPTLPPATFADIGGGSYPAVMNISLALLARARTGRGAHLDIAMAENLFPFIYWAIADGLAGHWPRPSGELLTGGSPRYALYRTADGEWLAVAAIEQRFWNALCEVIGLDSGWRDDRRDPAGTQAAVAALIAARPAADWAAALADVDACTNLVRDVRSAIESPQARARGLFAGEAAIAGDPQTIPLLHLPVAPTLRRAPGRRDAPPLH
jgi:crotonobetainyl-CoA:carnitine CoA-transferase CaiB-like acyl-CoA transferase